MHVIAVAVALLLATTATASTPYELLVAGRAGGCGAAAAEPRVEFAGPSPVTTRMATIAAAGPHGRLFGFDSDGFVATLHPTGPRWSIAVLNGGSKVLAMTVDRDERIHALAVGREIGTTIFTFAEGHLPRRLRLDANVRPSWGRASIDLAADQCSLFITDQLTRTIRRANVCSALSLPMETFAEVQGVPNAVRVLPDGGALVAAGGDLLRYDAAGVLVRTYARVASGTEITALALERGGAIALVAADCSGEVAQLDLETGVVSSRHTTSVTAPTSIVPYDAWTAAIGGTATPVARYDAAALTSNGTIEWVASGAVVSTTRLSVPSAAMAPAGAGLMRIGTSHGYVNRIEEIGPDNRRNPFSGGSPAGNIRLMVVAASRATYVVANGSLMGGEGLWMHHPNGTNVSRPLTDADGDFPLAVAVAIDLAADQCTMFAIERGRIRRYSVCMNVNPGDFLAATSATALRVLPDGGVLVSDGDSLLRYDRNATLVRTYTLHAGVLGAMTLADGGRTAWVAARSGNAHHLLSLDLERGTVMSSTPLQAQPTAISPARVWTAALSQAPRRRAVSPR